MKITQSEENTVPFAELPCVKQNPQTNLFDPLTWTVGEPSVYRAKAFSNTTWTGSRVRRSLDED